MLDPITIIKTLGLAGIFLMIFAESGLFFGFFLPGDTLLFAAGIFAAQGMLPIEFVIIGSIVAAILGDNIGYWFGKKVGRKIFERTDSFLFNKERIIQTEKFYQKHGPITIILARFIPFIRTFAPIIAGVAGMNYRKFFLYNIVGGIAWIVSVTLLGYYFGSLIPNIELFLLPILFCVILLSLLPFLARIAYKFFKKKDTDQ